MELKPLLSYLGRKGFSLLIVPYGIETRQDEKDINAKYAFNRTLWN